MKKLLTFAFLLLPLMACTGNIGTNQYSTSSAGQINTTWEGTVINVRTVTVSTDNGMAGTLAGGVAGGVAGSAIGGGTGSTLAAVGGAVLGGILGNATQEKLSTQTGLEYIVKLDSGKSITLTQGTDVQMSVGQKVYVLDGGTSRARIIPR